MSEPSFDETIVNEPCAKAPLNPRWIFKLGVIAFIVFAVGVWGYLDATVVYPNRGEKYADWAKWQYLEQAKRADSEDFGLFLREVSVPNPREELERLSDPEQTRRNREDANNPNSTRTLRASMFNARKQWLEALSRVGMLKPEHTVIESPQRELSDLQQKWSQVKGNPKPLAGYDIPSQWLIMVVCFSVALIMVVHMLRVRARHYAWDPASMTLTLPGGAKVTPEDLDEVDKRKWDKFIVFLKIKGAHPDLGGQEVSIDTYQHQRVEDWILAMEARAFPAQEQDDAPSEPQADTTTEPTERADAEQDPAADEASVSGPGSDGPADGDEHEPKPG